MPTDRELEVFEIVCRLGGDQPAADELSVSLQTVKNTLGSLYRKLGTVTAGQTAYRLWYGKPRDIVLDDLENKVLAIGDTAAGQEGWLALAAVVGLITKARRDEA